MNVYDFDGTIYYANCIVNFFIWCANRQIKLWFTFAPKMVIKVILYKLGKLPFYRFIRDLFKYLSLIDDFDKKIEMFWDKHEKRISRWYLDQKRPDDLIISASPSCIIEPIAKRLGVQFMATEFDIETNVFLNNFMFSKEKSRYLIDHGFPYVENFYSDSLSDTPLALCAEKAHLVKKRAQVVVDWPELNKETWKKVHKEIDKKMPIHLD